MTKTPLKIRLWTFVHDQAEHLWGYIWRKKLAPYHEQKWKEEMEKRVPVFYASVDSAWPLSSEAIGCDIYRSVPGSGYVKVQEVRWDTEKERMN